MFKKKILAIVPARSGSQRLKNKNILKLIDKPLINWTIYAALNSKFIDDIVVTTNSEKIIKTVKNFSKNILFIKRPEYLSTSNASSEAVVMHSIKKLKNKKFNHDIYILLQPTSPLRNKTIIDNAIINFIKNIKIKTLVAVSKVSNSKNTIKINNKGYINKINIIDKKVNNINYSINGSIYLGFINNFLKNMNFFEYNCLAFKMNRTNSIDIDTIFDFKLAEKYLKKIKKI